MSTSQIRADPGRLPAVLTVGQAAELPGIGRRHAYEAVKTGLAFWLEDQLTPTALSAGSASASAAR
jgi:hypothetical protein